MNFVKRVLKINAKVDRVSLPGIYLSVQLLPFNASNCLNFALKRQM